MKESDMETVEIYDLLYRLGVPATYTGFFHVSYAVQLIINQPDRLLLVTKWLYPDIARHYGTSWQAVERNIRTVAAVAWERRPDVLEQFAHGHLDGRPRPAQFLAILAAYFYKGRVA